MDHGYNAARPKTPIVNTKHLDVSDTEFHL